MPMKRVLVVDDEPKITEVVRLYLEREGYQVAVSGDGRQALDQAARFVPDLVVLDLNLPDVDGLEVCRSLRKTSDVPIIMLTGRGQEADKVSGLEIGADDYITKPFSPRELTARVKAVLRRRAPDAGISVAITVGDLIVDPGRYEARCKGVHLDLTTTEFKLLSALARHPGQVYTRTQLLDMVQGDASEAYDRTVDVHIKNLRQKLAPHGGGANCHIQTVRGVGYKLEVAGNEL